MERDNRVKNREERIEEQINQWTLVVEHSSCVGRVTSARPKPICGTSLLVEELETLIMVRVFKNRIPGLDKP